MLEKLNDFWTEYVLHVSVTDLDYNTKILKEKNALKKQHMSI